MKNLTTIAKERSIKYNQLKKQLNELNILQGSTPTEEALIRGIAIMHIFNNGLVGRTYYKYDPHLIDDHISNQHKLPTIEKKVDESWVTYQDDEYGEIELPF